MDLLYFEIECIPEDWVLKYKVVIGLEIKIINIHNLLCSL